MEVVQKYDNERGKGACWANIAKKLQAGEEDTFTFVNPSMPGLQPQGPFDALQSYTNSITSALKLLNAAAGTMTTSAKVYPATSTPAVASAVGVPQHQVLGVPAKFDFSMTPAAVNNHTMSDSPVTVHVATEPCTSSDSQEHGTTLEMSEVARIAQLEREKGLYAIDAARATVARRQLNVALFHASNGNHAEAAQQLKEVEATLTGILFGGLGIQQAVNARLLVEPNSASQGHLQQLVLSGHELGSGSPADIVSLYGITMWARMSLAIQKAKLDQDTAKVNNDLTVAQSLETAKSAPSAPPAPTVWQCSSCSHLHTMDVGQCAACGALGPPPAYPTNQPSSSTTWSSGILSCGSGNRMPGNYTTAQETAETAPHRCDEALTIARQLLRSMQLHLEPKRVLDPLTAYSWAALASSFIERDPSYTLHALCKLDHVSTLPLLRKLVDMTLWCASSPSPAVQAMNSSAGRNGAPGLFDVHIIADAIDRSLSRADPAVRSVLGDMVQWKLPFVDAQSYHAIAQPKPAIDPQRDYPRFLDVRRLPRPWEAPWGGASSGKPKAVVLMLDTSGSMGVGATPETSRLAKCVQNMLMVFDEHLADDDYISYVEFNNRVHTKNRMAQKQTVAKAVRANIMKAEANGGTAFFDSMVETIQNLAEFQRQHPDFSAYILALTDGSDQHSQRGNEHSVLSSLQAHSKITPLIIGAGNGLDHSDVSKMRLLVGEAPLDQTVGGMYISASDDPDKLREAFQTAAAQMNATPFEQL